MLVSRSAVTRPRSTRTPTRVNFAVTRSVGAADDGAAPDGEGELHFHFPVEIEVRVADASRDVEDVVDQKLGALLQSLESSA